MNIEQMKEHARRLNEEERRLLVKELSRKPPQGFRRVMERGEIVEVKGSIASIKAQVVSVGFRRVILKAPSE